MSYQEHLIPPGMDAVISYVSDARYVGLRDYLSGLKARDQRLAGVTLYPGQELLLTPAPPGAEPLLLALGGPLPGEAEARASLARARQTLARPVMPEWDGPIHP